MSNATIAHLALSKKKKVKRVFHSQKQLEFLYDTKTRERFYALSEKQREFLVNSGKFKPHMLLRKEKKAFWIGGRGSGKTNTLGKLIFNMYANLPQCSVGLASLSYKQILNNCLPEVKKALRQFGVYQDVHYVFGKKPKSKKWLKPFQEIEDFEYVLSFNNGLQIELLSNLRDDTLDRGKSFDALIGDEIGFIDKDWWETVLIPTVRGSLGKKVRKNPLHRKIAGFSSAPPNLEGQWIFQYEEMAQSDKDCFFIESTPVDNPYAGISYMETLKKIMPLSRYEIEVLNKRLKRLENAFYPSFSEKKHVINRNGWVDNGSGIYVKGQLDYQRKKELMVSFDFNAAFTSMVVAQDTPDELNFINHFFVKWQTVDKLVEKFCQYYSNHEDKTVVIYGDRNGFDEDYDTGKSTYDVIVDEFERRGWTCQIEAIWEDIQHKHKFFVINTALDEKLDLPRIRINKRMCGNLTLSILNSPLEKKGSFQKDKSSETNENIPQELATHLSDCFDYLVYLYYVKRMYDDSGASTSSQVLFTN